MGGTGSKENCHPARGSGNHRDMHRVFLTGSVDLIAAAHPRVTTASLLLSPIHTPTLFHSAHPWGGSLFPNCNACFCSILASAWRTSVPPPPSLRPRNQTCGKHGSRQRALEKPGVSGSEGCPQPASPSGSGREQLIGVCSGAQHSGTQSGSGSLLGCVTLGNSLALSWPQFSNL